MFSGLSNEVIEEAKKRAALYSEKTGKKYIVYGVDSLNNYVGKLKWVTIGEESELEAYQLDTKPTRTAIQWRDYAKTGGGILAVAALVGTTAHFIYWLDKRKKKIAEGKGDIHE